MYLNPDRVEELKSDLAKLNPAQNADSFHKILGTALRYLGYEGIEAQIVAYDRRKKKRTKLEGKSLQEFDPTKTVFLREEIYTKKGATVQLITVYTSHMRVRGKKASLWFIEASSDLDIKRKTASREDLVKKVRARMGKARNREERIDYARKAMEGMLEETLIRGEDGTCYLSCKDINRIVKLPE
ncbi:hypothetical protein HY500_02720 [Candidatus Woesearchaeota archaeon]|nr:hypothetical protein [Candidatus Woesearchaeota archaeon]